MRESNKDINEIVASNIKLYIDAIGRSQKWVYEKAGIPKPSFYKLLKGEGDLNKTIPKLNNLFRIEDPFYFYNLEFNPPRTIKQIRSSSSILANSSLANTNDLNFNDTLKMLEDFISMIDVLETMKEITQVHRKGGDIID